MSLGVLNGEVNTTFGNRLHWKWSSVWQGDCASATRRRGLGELFADGLPGLLDALFQPGSVPPTETVESGDVHELAGGAVGFGGVEDQIAGEAEDACDGLGELADGDVLACADVDEGRGVFGEEDGVGVGVEVEQVHAGLGEVVGVQELAAGGAGAPDGDLGRPCLDGLGGFADERGQNVGVGEVEVVSGAVEVGGHGGEIAGAVLPVVAPAHLDAGDLGEGVGAVGGLERAGEEGGLGHGLGGELGVDAGGAEKEEAIDAGLARGLDDVVLDDEVVADEVGWVGVVGEDAADLGGGEDDELGPLLLKEAGYGGGVEEVELGARAGEDLGVAETGELAVDGGADEAAVSGDVDTGVRLHVGRWHGVLPSWSRRGYPPPPPPGTFCKVFERLGLDLDLHLRAGSNGRPGAMQPFPSLS